MSKVLIAYFSATGRTKKLAEDLAGLAGADIFRIEPEIPYTEKDLNWKNPLSRTMKEYISRKEVEISGKLQEKSVYDTIIIGFPVWFLKEPNIIDTFIKGYDFSGKTVAFFATSHKIDVEKADKNLAKLLPGADWKGGILANDKNAAELRRWFQSNGLEI